jgi:hypothetical protein
MSAEHRVHLRPASSLPSPAVRCNALFEGGARRLDLRPRTVVRPMKNTLKPVEKHREVVTLLIRGDGDMNLGTARPASQLDLTHEFP